MKDQIMISTIDKKEERRTSEKRAYDNSRITGKHINAARINMLEINYVNKSTRGPVNKKSFEESDQEDEIIPETQQNVRRKRRRFISKKGMRHISRIKRLLSGDIKAHHVMGKVENSRLNIIMDTRGEFNVITKKAVDMIEENANKLKRNANLSEIPAYLKREKYTRIEAVKIKVQVFGRTINIEAMELEGEEPCLILARNARRQLANQIRQANKKTSQEKGDNEKQEDESNNSKGSIQIQERLSDIDRWSSVKSKTVMQQWDEEINLMRDKLEKWKEVTRIKPSQGIANENRMTKINIRSVTKKKYQQEESEKEDRTDDEIRIEKPLIYSKEFTDDSHRRESTTTRVEQPITSPCNERSDVSLNKSQATAKKWRKDTSENESQGQVLEIEAIDEKLVAKPIELIRASEQAKRYRKATPESVCKNENVNAKRKAMRESEGSYASKGRMNQAESIIRTSDSSRDTIEIIRVSDSDSNNSDELKEHVNDTYVIPSANSYIDANDLLANSSDELLVLSNGSADYKICKINPNHKINEWFVTTEVQKTKNNAKIHENDKSNVIGYHENNAANERSGDDQSDAATRSEHVAIKQRCHMQFQSESSQFAACWCNPLRRKVEQSETASDGKSHKRKYEMELESEEREVLKRATASLLYEKLAERKRRRIAYLKSITAENKTTKDNLEPEQVKELLKKDEKEATSIFEEFRKKHDDATNAHMIVDLTQIAIEGKHVANVKTMVNIEAIDDFDKTQIPPTRITIDIVRGQIHITSRECGVQPTQPSAEMCTVGARKQYEETSQEKADSHESNEEKDDPDANQSEQSIEKEESATIKPDTQCRNDSTKGESDKENQNKGTFKSSISEKCKTNKRRIKIIRVSNPKILSITKRKKSTVYQTKTSPVLKTKNDNKKNVRKILSDESNEEKTPPTTPKKALNLAGTTSLSPFARVGKSPRGDAQAEPTPTTSAGTAQLASAVSAFPVTPGKEWSGLRATSVRLQRMQGEKPYAEKPLEWEPTA
ncbi:myb-like protein P [Monomorium pharaonis]|uniref:myb-like protein P n=1 Tax=Monomorium pharaonis TaxID=307658 RepID=UPI00174710C3|nr:myb-like protein P [Monomorium pharaonis]